jgi:hypothetical protein
MKEKIVAFIKWILVFISIFLLWLFAVYIASLMHTLESKKNEKKNERKYIFSLECRWKLSDEEFEWQRKNSDYIIYKEFDEWYLFKANVASAIESNHNVPFYLYRGAHRDSKFNLKEKYYKDDLAIPEEVLIKQDTQFYYYFNPGRVYSNETAYKHSNQAYFKDGDLYSSNGDFRRDKTKDKKISYRKINRTNLEMTYIDINGFIKKSNCIEITEIEFYNKIKKAAELRFKF